MLAKLLAPAEIGLLIADYGGRLRAAAVSSGRAGEVCQVEERSEGPCGRCYRSGVPSHGWKPGTRADQWPEFGRACRDAGFRLVSVLPMRRHDQTIGAVCVLSTGTGPGPVETDLALMLTEAATIGILQLRELEAVAVRTVQLQIALDSRVVIEQAKGAVAARAGTSPAAAFELLRSFARRHNRTLAAVASAAISGELAVQDLTAPPPRARRGGARPAGHSL